MVWRQRVGSGLWGIGWTLVAWLAVAPDIAGQEVVRASSGEGVVAASTVDPGSTATEGLRAARIVEAPSIDGRLDEEVWSQAQVATGFVQQSPAEGEPASEETEVRVLLGDDAIYVGARLRDRAPEGIVTRLGRRDEATVADWFYLYLDSYHDRRTAFAFGVSASGVQRDLRVADDVRVDQGWDAVWASRVRRDAGGWTAELAIPLSQLRFNAGSDDARWGVNFRRDIARRNETAYWAPIPQGGDRFVSLFSELRGLSGIEPERRLEILPYTVAGVVREPGAAADPFHESTATRQAVGADLRLGLGSSLTLSATINPDFGQVEADPATVNLTAFEIFQQERRPFFVEGSDIFSLSFPFWPPLFYSRRIGRGPQGFAPPGAVHQERPNATTILGALKLSGKTEGGWSVGLLGATTGRERVRYVDDDGRRHSALIEPRTTYSVARVFRELRDGGSGVGAMVTATNRDLDGGAMDWLHGSAYAFGADAFHRFAESEYIANLSVLGSHVRGSETAILRTQRAAGHYFQRPDAGHVEVDPTRTSLSGMSVSGRVQRVRGRLKWGLFGEATSPGYEVADLGFNPTLDQQSVNAWLRWEDFTQGRIFQNWSLGTMTGMQRGFGGELRELTADLGFFFQLRNYWGGGVWVMRHRPTWTPTALRGGPALRRPGRWMGSFNVNSDRRRDVSGNGSLFWTVEDEGDGYQMNASANVSVRPDDRLDLRLGPTFSRGFDSWQFVARRGGVGTPLYLVGGLERRTVALSARVDYTLSPTLSLQLYARPFLASGRYRALREVADPAAEAFDERFRTYTDEEAESSGGAYSIDRDGDGTSDLTVPDPSFNVASLQMNTVLRWEYRPGSTLFAVWTHDRSRFGDEPWELAADVDRLIAAPGRNVFQLKVSYWMGL